MTPRAQSADEAAKCIASIRRRKWSQRYAKQWVHRLIYSPPPPNWTEEAREMWLAFYEELE